MGRLAPLLSLAWLLPAVAAVGGGDTDNELGDAQLLAYCNHAPHGAPIAPPPAGTSDRFDLVQVQATIRHGARAPASACTCWSDDGGAPPPPRWDCDAASVTAPAAPPGGGGAASEARSPPLLFRVEHGDAASLTMEGTCAKVRDGARAAPVEGWSRRHRPRDPSSPRTKPVVVSSRESD